MIFIREDKVRKLLDWNNTFRAVEKAMVNVAKNRAVQNARSFTKVLNSKNLLLTMPGYLEDDEFGALACKLVTLSPNNVHLEKPLPTINANIMLFDQNNGLLKAVIEGTEITKWRTAAASAVATKYVFRNNVDECNILAILGCGVQGKIHAEAFRHFFNFKEIRLWNRNINKAISLASELNAKFSSKIYIHVESNKECVQNADVIITATNASSPIVKFDWVKKGTHINAIGAGLSHHSELDEQLYLNSDVYVDHLTGAASELSGLEKLGVKFKGEIGSVISGDLPKASSDRITVFQSLGMAVEDCALAQHVFELHTTQK